jgi:tetratricopeptide (TPR) repeat protein
MRGTRRQRVVFVSLVGVALALLALSAGEPAAAQLASVPQEDNAPLNAAEQEAFQAVEQHQLLRARELAEAVVARDPRSWSGHLVLALAQHFAEANFPRALYHASLARALYEARYGTEPRTPAPFLWHARIIKELADVHGARGHHAVRIALIERFNRSYQPRMVAEVAWSLMKMGRYDEARAAARLGLAENRPGQTVVALNALCGIEFEAGRDGASYDACGQALAYAREHGGPSVVDLTNFSESARSMFQLAESERILLEATEAQSSLYGNPWMELAELYTRAGRFAEAAQALQQISAWRARRPPHVQDADRNESRRAIAEFMVVTGLHERALTLTDKAMVTPDRRSHNSRDPAQDRCLTALLDRRARRMVAESRVEAASASPWYERVGAHAEATLLRAQAWLSGRQATRILTANDELLIGLHRRGSAGGAIQPPWLTGDLIELFCAGVMQAAIERADAADPRPAADPYYASLLAEVALSRGDLDALRTHAGRALAGVGAGDALLRARVMALLAQAGEEGHYDAVLGTDPSAFRRLEVALPVRLSVTGDAVAQEVATAIRRSPRFQERSDAPLQVQVNVNAGGGRVCLLGGAQRVFGCGEAGVEHDEDDVRSMSERIVSAFHDDVFAPRVDLSQAQINSLDGSTQPSRNPLETLFGPVPVISPP